MQKIKFGRQLKGKKERERDDSHRNECIVEVRKRVKRKDKSKTIIKERS